jgi:hypothetical protein
VELLFDDKWIDRRAGVKRVLAQPVKGNKALLPPDKPWETAGLEPMHSVMWDAEEKKFKLWYRAHVTVVPKDARAKDKGIESSEQEYKGRRHFLCYAESVDGERWTKPPLGLFEFDGSRDNNILREVGGASFAYENITKDPNPSDPDRRYKAIEFEEKPVDKIPEMEKVTRGVAVAYSPDGLRWTDPKLVVTATDMTDANSLLPHRDPRTGKWVCYMRPRTHPKRRFVGLSTSDDFEHWTYPQMILTPDANDSEFLEFYGVTVMMCHGFYVGMVRCFNNHPAFSPMTNGLVFSRDNMNWQRVMPGVQFLPQGPSGSADSVMIGAISMFRRGNETWLYYSGGNRDHGSDRAQDMPPGRVEEGQERKHIIGLAKFPFGHFCGLEATTEAIVETKYLANYGQRGPRAIAAMQPNGWISAEILDHYACVLPGFEKKNCRAIAGDDGLIRFEWGDQRLEGRLNDKSPEGGLVQRVVKVRFYLHYATLFGFSIGEAGGW